MKITVDGSHKLVEIHTLTDRKVAMRIWEGDSSFEVLLGHKEAAIIGAALMEYAKG